MLYQKLDINGIEYKWSAAQDSEQPDFVLVCERGEIWVQVEIGLNDRPHNQRHFDGFEKYPISNDTARKIICAVVKLGYLDNYFDTDVGLIFTETGKLVEN